MLTRHSTATALACALVVAGAAFANADGDPDISKGSCDLMSFCVGVGSSDKTGGQDGKSSGSETNASTGSSKPSDCSVRAMDPQPPPGSEYYRAGKTVYERVCSVDGQNGLVDISVVGADPGQNVPALDPQVVAQQAIDKMLLAGPDININPKPGGKGLVGMPVWLAVDRSPTTWGPNTASATAGGVTVTATAKVSQIVWSMGDGTSVTCTSPGTVYKTSYGLKKSPDCGHVYTQPSTDAPGGTYKVTATSTWVIDWQVNGGGATGQLTEVRNSSVALTIVESQAVNS